MPRARPASANAEQVFRVLRSADAPMTAYEVLKSVQSERPWAPPTAYRALSRLVEEGRVHRLESINAYVACAHGHHAGVAAVIAICRNCGRAEELAEERLVEQLKNTAKAHGFQIDRTVIELTGRCAPCTKRPFSNQASDNDHEPRGCAPVSQPRQA
jgi:Fur family transcriptional regulator, zinc uptake regulator